jgi:glutaryl-CoA dehydrogenase
VAAYEAALAYSKERTQFGSPLAGFQLVQSKLAHMLAEITLMQLLCLRLSQLAAEGRMTDGMASLAKMNNAAKARRVVADARDILGGNGTIGRRRRRRSRRRRLRIEARGSRRCLPIS